MRGDNNVNDGMIELIVDGNRIDKHEDITNTVKTFWGSISSGHN